MDGATFNWVFTFLAQKRKDIKTENSNNIYTTLVKIYIKILLVPFFRLH